MDNSNIHSVFETLVNYEPHPAFQHLDIHEQYVELKEEDLLNYTNISPAYSRTSTVIDAATDYLNGHGANNLYYDEFVESNIITNSFLDTFNSYQPGYTIDFDPADYEVVVSNGTFKLVKKEKEAPDFGEFSPSQELNDFVDTLVLGE